MGHFPVHFHGCDLHQLHHRRRLLGALVLHPHHRYGNHMKGNWGDCNTTTCPTSSSLTTAAPATTCSTPCKFPFIYQGVVHNACTYAGGFSPAWCSTATDAYGKHINGNFADCGAGCPVEISG